MDIEILKCHGSDNDFILIDEFKYNTLTEVQRITIATVLCNRQQGIGADGILFYQPSSKADAAMRMFNPDGSEAEMCGNGIRCLGRYAIEQLGLPQVNIETMKAVLVIKQLADIYTGVSNYETTIAPVILQRSEQVIPSLSDHLAFTELSVPNPHIICFVDKVTNAELVLIGEKANHPDIFPQGINVSFCRIIGETSIFSATYERGAGLTNACGTAMSASCFSACLRGSMPFNEYIDVYNKGGMVRCKAHQHETEPHLVYLAGNATFEYQSLVGIDFDAQSIKTVSTIHRFAEEVAHYANFKQHCHTLLDQAQILQNL